MRALLVRHGPVGAAVCLQAIVVAAVAAGIHAGGAGHVAAALVVAPAGTIAVALAASRLRGRWFPALAAFVHVLLPLAAVPYFFGSYRHTYTHHALPWLLGLRAPGWVALGVGLAAAVALAPRLVLAVGGVGATIAAIVVWGFGEVDGVRLGGIHETAWSLGTLEWIAAAGALGALFRSPGIGLGIAGAVGLFLLRATHADYGSGGFWRELAPALPVGAVLVSSPALLVPRLPRPRVPLPLRLPRARA